MFVFLQDAVERSIKTGLIHSGKGDDESKVRWIAGGTAGVGLAGVAGSFCTFETLNDLLLEGTDGLKCVRYRSIVEIYGKEKVDAWIGNGIVGGRNSRSERLDEGEIG